MTTRTLSDIRVELFRFPLARPMQSPFGRLAARHNLIVIAELDNGVKGLGEIWANFPFWGCTEKTALFNEVVRPLLVGEALDDPARLYYLMQDKMRLLAIQWGAKGPVQQVIAGTDCALWDAFARAKGLPLAELLRGAPIAETYPVYASGLGGGDVASEIAKARAEGHRRFKFRISFGHERNTEVLAQARAAAGNDPVMADANQTLTPSTLKALASVVDSAQLDWLEEPFPADDVASFDGWPFGVSAPLAFGENIYGRDDFMAAVARWKPAVVQPDITKCGGITEGLSITRDMVAAGKRLCLHNYGCAVGLYVSAHVMAAVEGADWLEMDANPNPSFETTLTIRPQVENGALLLPPGPGLGVELNEAALGRWRVG